MYNSSEAKAGLGKTARSKLVAAGFSLRRGKSKKSRIRGLED